MAAKPKPAASKLKRQLAARDKPKKITGLTDKRDDPDRQKRKATRLDHGRRRVATKLQAIKSTAAAGSKVNPSKARRRSR